MSTIPAESRYRAPYLAHFQAVKEPLTVICTLLSRADNAPLSERRKDPNMLLDDHGQIVTDPAATPLAFEHNSNVAYEKWTEYWRKVHGPRFIYAQPPENNGIQHLLRYDQIHRLPAGPSSFSPLPYNPPVDASGKLFNTVIGHIPPYQRGQWDGIAYLNFADFDGIKAVFGQAEIAEKIMPEDQAIFRELAPVVAKQHIVIPSQTQRESILLIKVLHRRPEFSREEFQNRWLKEHALFVVKQAATTRYVKRYVQLHNIGPTEAGQPFYHAAAAQIDGVAILAFNSINDLEDYLQDETATAIAADEARLADQQASQYWTALSYQVVNQIYPETSTLR